MSVKVANSRFIFSSRYGALYQQLVTISDFDRLGKWLVAECEKAQMLRQTEKLKELSLILSGIPIQEYQLIGQFYQGFTRLSQNPRKVFEDVIEKSNTYKSKALIALAALELKDSNYDLGIKFCSEAIRRSHNVSTIIHAARNISVIKSAEGFHASAFKDLEAIAPLVRYASPVARYQYFNSLAVEYGEIGRVEEASNISRIVLASPFAFAYPEWRETGQDLALRGYKSRSSIPVIQSFLVPEKQPEKIQNVLHFPGRNTAPVRLRTKPAKVLSYVDWKERMVKEEKDEIPPDADEGDLYLRLMEMIALKDLNAWELRQVIDFVEKLRPNAEEN